MTALTAEETLARMRALKKARDAEQRNCKHNWKPVTGTTAYLRCHKCGERIDND